jgi:hypothetical protein
MPRTTTTTEAPTTEGSMTDILRGDPEVNTRKAIEARVAPSIDPAAGIDVACFMTTDQVDADDEIVLPSGADLSRFEKNPVLLLCHGYGQPGALPRAADRPRRLDQEAAQRHDGRREVRPNATAMARDVKGLFEEGMLRSFSIGFRSLEASPLTRDEANSRPTGRPRSSGRGARSSSTANGSCSSCRPFPCRRTPAR